MSADHLDDLRATCDQALIDGLDQPLKDAIARAVRRGMPVAYCVEIARSEGQLPLTLLAIEAWAERVRAEMEANQ